MLLSCGEGKTAGEKKHLKKGVGKFFLRSNNWERNKDEGEKEKIVS